MQLEPFLPQSVPGPVAGVPTTMPDDADAGHSCLAGGLALCVDRGGPWLVYCASEYVVAVERDGTLG